VYHPGPLATFALLMWIPISAILFSNHNPRKAALLVFLWGTMVLPEVVAIDPPILPPVDKHLLVGMCAFTGLFMTSKQRFERMRLLRGIQAFFFIFIVGNFGTAFSNPESWVVGGAEYWPGGPRAPIKHIPALPQKEFIAMSIQDFVTYLMPFGVGQMLVQSREDVILFLKAAAFGALVYVPLMLWEGMMSPQLHRQVYGYYSTSFAHNIRGDGYKPVVFMKSGLGVAMFEFIGLAAAMTLIRVKEKITPTISGKLGTAVIMFALSVSRNVAVVVYAVGVMPLFLMSKPKMMMRAAFVLGMVFLTFPITPIRDRESRRGSGGIALVSVRQRRHPDQAHPAQALLRLGFLRSQS